MTHRVHLDYASSAPLFDEVKNAMKLALDNDQFDPRRLYDDAIKSRYEIEDARIRVAEFFGCDPFEVIFTSSHSESLATFAFGAIDTTQNRFLTATGLDQHRVIATPYDSEVLLKTWLRENIDIQMLAGNNKATLDVSNLDSFIDESTKAITIPFAHPDTGTLQDFNSISTVVRQSNPDCLIHLDARLAAGNIDLNFSEMDIDAMSVDPSTFGGPSGVAALILSRRSHLSPLLIGATQERARRAGLENHIGIIGFATACDRAQKIMPELIMRNHSIKKKVCDSLMKANAKSLDLDPDASHSLAHMTSAYFPGIAASAVVAEFNRLGINIHAGSSCGSEEFEPSAQLAPVTGDDALSESVFRISWGHQTTDEDIAEFKKVLEALPFHS